MKFSRAILTSVALAATLAACGGGGGSSGTVSAEYQITLRADNTQLPLNVSNQGPGIGVYAPYSTTLYVQATVNGAPIPGGKEIFGCNSSAGLSSGALYYLDGDTAHEKDGIPGAYRSITLDSNSGGNSFHFNAGNQSGRTTITCSVQDPRDKQMKSASVSINVGGATGKVASIQPTARANGALGYLGVVGNVKNIPPSVAIQATVRDDSNQLITNPSSPNLQIAIRQNLGGAAEGARLGSGSVTGGAIQVSTNNGVGTFSLMSGSQTGPIVLELTADRADNNVANGIQDPIVTLYQVYAVSTVASSPLTITVPALGDVPNGVPFTYALQATGGVPPFTWTVSGLPAGLTANSSGVVSGTPLAPQGKYALRVNATDANGTDATPIDTVLNLTGQPLTADDFTISYCTSGDGSSVSKPCALPGADPGSTYTYAFSSSVAGVTWTFSGLPSWLSGSTAGASGVITGTPKKTLDSDPLNVTCGDSGKKATFLVTATSGALSVKRYVSIAVSGTLNTKDCP